MTALGAQNRSVESRNRSRSDVCLLCGLLPTEGDVAWDHASTADLDPWVGVVGARRAGAAEVHVSALTMRDNITFGRGDTSDAALLAACEASGTAEMLQDLRSSLNTLLTSEWFDGQPLSGGQWQRLVLTRAFHLQAALLVIDEPTAALDARAEHRIFVGLRELAKGRAILLITHRLTNVAIGDRIMVLNEGRTVQEGTYAQLTREPGLFRTLWELQRQMKARDTGPLPMLRTPPDGQVITLFPPAGCRPTCSKAPCFSRGRSRRVTAPVPPATRGAAECVAAPFNVLG
ncbi:ATP-binding cassette domain-containing protein [Streptomyces sp. NPDC004135]